MVHLLLATWIFFIGGAIDAAAAAKGKDQPTLEHFFVFGDRYSGVNYLTKLLKKNGPSHNLTDCSPPTGAVEDSSWKYGPFTTKRVKRHCDPRKTLFVFITKDPHSWLASVAKRKYAPTKLQTEVISNLVHSKW